MKFKLNNNIIFLIIIFLITLILFFFSSAPIFLIHPKGIISLLEKKLILTSIILMLTIITPVLFMTIYFFLKYINKDKKNIYKPNWCKSKKIEILIWLIPIFIISILGLITVKTTYELDPYKSIISCNKPINIEVISLDWKWLFIYPEKNIATINEIYFPKNTPIDFKITSNSVMNSFFIPKLGSQIYSMTGMESKLHLISNESGNYEGFSSSFSGKGFSNMKFNVIVTKDNNNFENWVNLVKSNKNILNDEKFEILNRPSENNKVEYFSEVKKDLFKNTILNYK